MKLSQFRSYAALSVFLCAVIVGATSNLTDPPNLLHQWRQCDGLSMSLNYYEEGLDFFSPQIHFQDSENGKAVGEFPVLYYANAMLWEVFGHSHFSARLLNLLVFLVGLYFLSLTSFRITKDEVVSVCVPLLVLSAPLIARYSSSFLPNTTALSFLFISVYYFVKYNDSKRQRDLIICLAFSVLSALLRTTMLIGFVPLLAVAFYQRVGIRKLALLCSPLLAVLIWVLYIKSYNTASGSVYFLTKITPLWEMSLEQINSVWELVNGNIKYSLITPVLMVALVVMMALAVLKHEKVDKKVLLYVSLVYLATLAYFALWFKKVGVHDYYYVELFVLVPAVVVLFGTLEFSRNRIVQWSLIVVTALCVISGATKNRFVRNPSSELNLVQTAVLKGPEVSFWNWFHDNYNTTFRAFETVKPFMRELGIERDDLVFSIQDPSPNVTLYLMDVKGYTKLYQHDKTYDQQIQWMAERGVKYLVTVDKQVLEEISKGLVGEHLGSWENIDVWRIYKQ